MKTKRFLVFAGDNYYPNGGWHDFSESFDDMNTAVEFARNVRTGNYDWSHVLDSERQKVIAEF